MAQLEPLLASDTIVASNTSTIPLAKLSAPLRDPGRLCGCHFFLPVGQAAMVEIIRGEKTRPETIAAAVDFANAIDHLPLVVADAPGFVVNRLLVPYLAEAMQLLTEGVTVEAVETAAETFGMLMGPLRLLDEIGLDTALELRLDHVRQFRRSGRPLAAAGDDGQGQAIGPQDASRILCVRGARSGGRAA